MLGESSAISPSYVHLGKCEHTGLESCVIYIVSVYSICHVYTFPDLLWINILQIFLEYSKLSKQKIQNSRIWTLKNNIIVPEPMFLGK